MFRVIVTVFIFVFFAQSVYGQSYLKRRSRGFYASTASRNVILTFGTGTSHYFGDLAKDGDFSNIKANVNIGARYRFYDRLAISADLSWFRLTGDDATDPGKALRNLSFRSDNIEFSATLHVNLFPESRFYLRRFANPYAYGGVGVLNFYPSAELNGERHSLPPLHTEAVNYSNFAISFPVGGGVKFRINPYFNIALEGSYHFLLTDYLDDVSSGIYPSPSSFTDPIARDLSDRSGEAGANPSFAEEGRMVRGNPDNNDGFMIFNVKLEYYFMEIKPSYYHRRIKSYKKNRRRVKPPKRRRM